MQAAIIVDVMWYARNQSVHEGLVFHPSDLVVSMKRRYLEHRAAWRAVDIEKNLVWNPPDAGVVKVNCDVAVRGNSSYLAVVARDHEGTILLGRSDFVCSNNPLLAELRAILLASQTAEFYQAPQVIIESDSLSSCRIVNDPTFISEGPLVAYANLIREILGRHQSWRLKWIPRRQNQVAHQMAAWIASILVFDFFSAACLPLSVTSADDPLDTP